ncbi:hypothetical protein ACFC96_17045 [Streptomyces sp. NPDC055955]|uniref:hypothetical protein n=1 Tax=Streptomyces sp. NPDC055955 TaxID=3345665 RepID=UPI0035E0E9D5
MAVLGFFFIVLPGLAIAALGTVAALGFFFIVLPGLAIVAFAGFAACRARRQRFFKVLAAVLLTAGLTCALVPAGMIVWLLTP